MEPNNPAYRPEYKELEEARKVASNLLWANTTKGPSKRTRDSSDALRWLAAEVRVMRLERALEW